MWNNSMNLFGSLAGDCSILQRRLQKQNSTQSSLFERKSVGATASAGEFFVRKFKKKYPCKSKSSDLAGKTGGKG